MSKIKKYLIFIIAFFLILFIKNISYSYSVGEELLLSENDMRSRNDIYCVAHKKRFGADELGGLDQDHRFQIVRYVKIEGENSIDDQGRTANKEENAILAAILAGPLEKGYGKNENYKPAQKALYQFWDTWITNVGIPDHKIDGFDHESGNSGVDGSAYLQEAKNYIQNGTVCNVEIYVLRYIGDENEDADNFGVGALQELIIAVPGNPTPPPTVIPQYDGYILISGKVWVDGEAGKANNINGTYGDSTDKGLGGIRVTLRDSSGNLFGPGTSTTTDSSGNYTITVNYTGKNSPYQLEENHDVVEERLKNGAYIEFEYDGIKYTTVRNSPTGTNTSKAKEDQTGRNNVDKQYTVVVPNQNTSGATVSASTKGVISFGSYSNMHTETRSVCIDYCHSNNSHTYTDSNDSSIVHNAEGIGLHLIHEGYDYKYIRTLPDGTEQEWGPFDNPQSFGEGWKEIAIRDTTEDIYCDRAHPGGHSITPATITNLCITDVNLGLFVREQPDIALTSDIQQVDVIMKNQKYSYVYGNKGIDSTDQFFDTQVKFQNKYTYTYRRPVNPADVAYVNQNGTNDLEVQVTYRVLFKNQSNTLPVTVRDLITYYDLNYTIIECSSGTAGGKSGGQNGYYSSTINNLNIVINPQASAELTIKYDISQTAIKGLLNQEATLNNVVEIYSYSTQYGSNTLCAEQWSGGTLGKTGWAYAGVDVDSQPGNASVYYDQSNNILNVTDASYQDDTDIAPSFVLVKDTEYKILSGNVWEDTATQESLNNNERLGNGVKDGNENVVANIKVELLKVNDDGTTEIAHIYTAENGTASSREAITYTDSNGNYSFGNNDTNVGQKEGVVTDNYIIKYTYGDDINGGASTINHIDNNGNVTASSPINARNYKSTIITTEPVKSVINGSNTSDKWHLTTQDNASIAVDNLTERANVDSQSLINSNFTNKNNMSAYTKPFRMQVEFTVDQIANVDANGGSFPKDLSIFDFGIIERPRENLVIDKTTSNLKITLANGQILIDGDPYNDNLDYVKALGNTITSRDVRVRDKLISIEIDTELIHGAKIDMTYAITATNNSEHDYDYMYGDSYYYYGEKGSLPLTTTTIEQVVDYVDDELTVTTDGENGDWTIVDWDYLVNNGYIDPKLNPNGTDPDRIENKNYTILVTDAFKNVTTESGNNAKTIYMHVSKLLGNQENEYTYENHVEIIQIGGKIARTIKEVKPDGTQVEKQYKPGNYKPTDASRVHEPDDDRIIARITPPTGLLDNIGTYIIILTISLLVIGVGTYIIKKRVLGK